MLRGRGALQARALRTLKPVWHALYNGQFAMALHLVNHTHVCALLSSTRFETTNLDHKATVVLVHLRTLQVTRLPYQPPGAFHHDVHYYHETQTFFVLFKQSTGKQYHGIIMEMDAAGTVLWQWNATNQPDLPCLQYSKLPPHLTGQEDCQHINALQYEPATEILFICIRRMEGFLALHKPTKQILWLYSTRKDIPQLAEQTLGVCGGHSSLWPDLQDSSYLGFHSFRKIGDNKYSVFANGDSSGRVFSVDRAARCIRPLEYYATTRLQRGSMGTMYRLPIGALVSQEERDITLFREGKPPALIQQWVHLAHDPFFFGPWVDVVVNVSNVLVLLANHLYVPYAQNATVSCETGNATLVACPDRLLAVELGAYMEVSTWPLVLAPLNGPWRTWLRLRVEVPYDGVSTTLQTEVRMG
eukprot:GGOE01056938.1.p1 GENE.GGOE01056938.1~~GGOE01056938.1.p1  ORF type:complete len:415 (-),score=124.36 GGOE01056938.1:214-1458(-)